MTSLAKMKAELVELEAQKKRLKIDIVRKDKRFKLCLWLAGGGVALLPLYGSGIIMILAGGIMAMIVSEQRTRLKDRLEEVDTQITKLELSMG